MIAFLPPIPTIPATDPRIVTVGRFDRTDPGSVACQWSACEVRLRVKGDTLNVTLQEGGKNLWQIVVDGKPTAVLAPHPDLGEYTIALGTDAVHDVSLVKRTEAFLGTTRFRGFDVPNGGLFQARRKAKTIEFVGDSITAAFGNEGADQNEQFSPETENAYLSYASIAARLLDADVRILAWSGRKMWPDNTVPEVYDRVLPTLPAPLADPKDPAPAAVVVNLATNDFAPGNPDERAWTGAYEAFVRRVWTIYPEAHVYAALGGMMTDDHPKGAKSLSTARGYLTRMVARIADRRLHFIEFDKQLLEDGIGSSWHPNVVTQRKMATRLAETMRRDLGW